MSDRPPSQDDNVNPPGEEPSTNPMVRPAKHRFLAENAPWLAAVGIAVLFVIILLSIFLPYLIHMAATDKTLLAQLAEVDAARGLITFLVAVTTVGIALVLVVYITSTTILGDEVKQRFTFGKEVLTSLIGILGTIIGFYFGATQTAPRVSANAALAISGLNLDTMQPKKGDTDTLHAMISGGKAPYLYSIIATQAAIKEIDDKSVDGTINKPIPLGDYDPSKPLDLSLTVTDSTGSVVGSKLHIPSAQ